MFYGCAMEYEEVDDADPDAAKKLRLRVSFLSPDSSF